MLTACAVLPLHQLGIMVCFENNRLHSLLAASVQVWRSLAQQRRIIRQICRNFAARKSRSACLLAFNAITGHVAVFLAARTASAVMAIRKDRLLLVQVLLDWARNAEEKPALAGLVEILCLRYKCFFKAKKLWVPKIVSKNFDATVPSGCSSSGPKTISAISAAVWLQGLEGGHKHQNHPSWCANDETLSFRVPVAFDSQVENWISSEEPTRFHSDAGVSQALSEICFSFSRGDTSYPTRRSGNRLDPWQFFYKRERQNCCKLLLTHAFFWWSEFVTKRSNRPAHGKTITSHADSHAVQLKPIIIFQSKSLKLFSLTFEIWIQMAKHERSLMNFVERRHHQVQHNYVIYAFWCLSQHRLKCAFQKKVSALVSRRSKSFLATRCLQTWILCSFCKIRGRIQILLCLEKVTIFLQNQHTFFLLSSFWEYGGKLTELAVPKFGEKVGSAPLGKSLLETSSKRTWMIRKGSGVIRPGHEHLKVYLSFPYWQS